MSKTIVAENMSAALKQRQYVGLDLLRWISAFSILCWHYVHFRTGIAPNHDEQPFSILLGPFIEHGRFAVQIFWAISGYIFFWKYAEVLNQTKMSGRIFTILRFSRLYPLHIVTLLIVAILQFFYQCSHEGHSFIFQHNDIKHFLFQLFFVSYWGLDSENSFNAPVWSISLELLAYAIFFFVARSINLNRWKNSALVTAVFALIWNGRVLLYLQFSECLLLFFIGGLTHKLAVALPSKESFIWRVVRSCCLLFVIATIVDLYVENILTEVFLGFEHVDTYIHFAFVPALLLLFAELPIRNEKLVGICESLGNLTYSSYMIHFPLQLLIVLIFDFFAMQRSLLWTPGAFLAFIVTVFFLAHFVYENFEKPAQKFLRIKLVDQIQ